MCGIAGCFGNHSFSKKMINSVLKSMSHRGPDGDGFIFRKLNGHNLSFFHTRLAIIDLHKHSSQPFIKDKLVLVFNGEIYNFIELRCELKKLGHSFKTYSDTEVVLEAYRAWGKNCVKRFEGMWSLAILDQYQGFLWLSRDRFGEKPLYLWNCNGLLLFASEVKTLAVMAGKWPKVNTNQIHRYLVNGFRSIYKKNITWFNDVQELPSSTNAIIYNPFKIIRSRYWELKYDPIDMSIDDAIAGIRERLVQSVKVRLRADVPIAFCLSGGVDSGTLASIASKEFQQKIHTFSIIDKDPRYNENTEINLVVRDLNCDHHAIKINQTRFFDNMENLITSHDAPVATISYYVHSLLSKMIHDYGYKVSISGVGADELFSGYYDHYSFWLAQMKMSSSSKFKSLLYDWQQLNMGFIRNPLLKDPMMFISNPNFRGHLYLNRSKFNSIMINPLEEDFFEEKYSGDLLRNRMLNELNHEIVPYILHEDDLNSMRYSIENRSPYLDRRLAEFAYNIPSKYLIKNGYSKWILRKSAKGYLTNDVRLYRQKKGFNASINSLIDLQDLDVIERLLSPSNIFNIVNKDLMKKMLLSNVSSNSMSKFIFSFISAKIFIDQHT